MPCRLAGTGYARLCSSLSHLSSQPDRFWSDLPTLQTSCRAWEALKVVIKEEEEQQRAGSTAAALASPTGAALAGLGEWLDGEEEYRLREDE